MRHIRHEIPNLDLSGLFVEELPAFLFTHPFFANAEIVGNECKKYPKELTVGSICNMELYEEMKNQVTKSKPSNLRADKVLSNPDLVLYSTTFLSPEEQKVTAPVSTSFRAADDMSSIKRLSGLRAEYREYLSPDLLAEVDIALAAPGPGNTTKKAARARTCKLLEVHIQEILPQILQDDSLVKTFPSMLPRLPQEIQQLYQPLAEGASPAEQAHNIRTFLNANQGAFGQVHEFEIPSLELHVIPDEMRLFQNLQVLDVHDNKISDLSSLRGLTRLNTIDISENKVSTLSDLQGLNNLEIILANNNKITDLLPLRNLIKLSYLILANNAISDISPLQGLEVLGILDLSNNKASDISPLENQLHIRSLMVNNNNISNIEILGTLPWLTTLEAKDNDISNISALRNCPHLLFLNLSNNNISDLPLQQMGRLRELRVADNNISDISTLPNSQGFTHIDIANNNITSPATAELALQTRFPNAEIIV